MAGTFQLGVLGASVTLQLETHGLVRKSDADAAVEKVATALEEAKAALKKATADVEELTETNKGLQTSRDTNSSCTKEEHQRLLGVEAELVGMRAAWGRIKACGDELIGTSGYNQNQATVGEDVGWIRHKDTVREKQAPQSPRASPTKRSSPDAENEPGLGTEEKARTPGSDGANDVEAFTGHGMTPEYIAMWQDKLPFSADEAKRADEVPPQYGGRGDRTTTLLKKVYRTRIGEAPRGQWAIHPALQTKATCYMFVQVTGDDEDEMVWELLTPGQALSHLKRTEHEIQPYEYFPPVGGIDKYAGLQVAPVAERLRRDWSEQRMRSHSQNTGQVAGKKSLTAIATVFSPRGK